MKMMKFRRMIVCCAVFVLVLLLGACNKELTKIKEGDILKIRTNVRIFYIRKADHGTHVYLYRS